MTKKFFKKNMTIVIGVATIVVDQITTIVVGIATIVVFCNNCGRCCNNCGRLLQLWTLRQLWSHQGSQMWKNIPVMFICQFFGELKGLQIQGNFPLISTRNRRRKLGDVSAWKFPKSFSAAYNKWSMLIKPPVRHPGNFIGDARKVPEFRYIFSNRGYTVDCSLDFPDFGGIKCMPHPNLPLLHLHAL